MFFDLISYLFQDFHRFCDLIDNICVKRILKFFDIEIINQ